MGDGLLIAADCQIHLDLLESLLKQCGMFGTVHATRSGREALELIKQFRPDVVLTDIPLRDLNGIDVIREVQRQTPETRVVVLSSVTHTTLILEALRAGASGVLLKKETRWTELLEVLAGRAENGKAFVSPSLLPLLQTEPKNRPSFLPAEAFSMISSREREVLQLVAEGKSSKQIASVLAVSVKTVDAHRQQLSRKLSLHSIAELTKFAVRQGLLDL